MPGVDPRVHRCAVHGEDVLANAHGTTGTAPAGRPPRGGARSRSGTTANHRRDRDSAISAPRA